MSNGGQTGANPLTLMLPVLPGQLGPLMAALAKSGTTIGDALGSIGTVHFARTALIDASQPNLQPQPPFTGTGPYFVGIITEYDGDFNTYIAEFVSQVGAVFDILLSHVVGGAALVPVKAHLQQFQKFLAANDMSQQQFGPGQMNAGLYAAYPQTVQDILAAFPPGD